MTHLFRYVFALVVLGAGFEACARAIRPVMHDASHRGLFKAALLSRKPETRVLFMGTSRTGEGLRPESYARAVGDPALVAFNASVQYSSFDQLLDLAPRFAQSPKLELVVIEVSNSQMRRGDVPWREPETIAADFDAKTTAFLRTHSALYGERKAFVLDSLARLVGILAVGHRFDGSEQFGSDYARKIFGGHSDAAPSEFAAVTCEPRPLDPPAALTEMTEEHRMYTELATIFSARGVRVVFYVPPIATPDRAPETNLPHRALFAQLHASTGAPVLDFAPCQLPERYFRDTIHMSKLGGSHFTHLVAAQLSRK